MKKRTRIRADASRHQLGVDVIKRIPSSKLSLDRNIIKLLKCSSLRTPQKLLDFGEILIKTNKQLVGIYCLVLDGDGNTIDYLLNSDLESLYIEKANLKHIYSVHANILSKIPGIVPTEGCAELQLVGEKNKDVSYIITNGELVSLHRKFDGVDKLIINASGKVVEIVPIKGSFKLSETPDTITCNPPVQGETSRSKRGITVNSIRVNDISIDITRSPLLASALTEDRNDFRVANLQGTILEGVKYHSQSALDLGWCLTRIGITFKRVEWVTVNALGHVVSGKERKS